jgi:hypothetical protein
MPGSERVAWIVRLVKIDAEGETRCSDVMAFERPNGLRTMADLGLTLAEAKQLLAAVQQQVVAEQAADHTADVPTCPDCGSSCRVKDYRPRAVATLFGRVMIRLPRFRCVACCKIERCIRWPAHCRSTPELDQLQTHLSALMTYRTAADLLVQMFPVDAGKDPETLRRRVLKAGAALEAQAVPTTAAPAAAISVTLEGTFVRSCEPGERHLEVRGCRVHDIDCVHRWLSWTKEHSCRRRNHNRADARLVPHCYAIELSETSCWRHIGDQSRAGEGKGGHRQRS